MDALNEIVYEFVKEDRRYRFTIPVSAPLGEAHEASAAFMDVIVKLIIDHNSKIKKLSEEDQEKEKEA